MARTIWTTALAICLAACGGKGTKDEGDADTGTDVGLDDGADTATHDSVTDPGDERDAVDDPVVETVEDTVEDVPVDTEPDGPVVGSCTGWPSSPDAYAFGPASRIDSVALPDFSGGTPSCCRDFGSISADYIERGTHYVDNALGQMLASLADAGAPSFDDELNGAISDGTLVILLDHRDLDGATDPDGFCLARLDGTSDGSGGYLAGRGSFVTGTGEPLETFPASMSAGEMVAGRGTFHLPIPLHASLVATFQDAELAGSASIGSTGVGYTAGTFSGYVPIEDFLGAYNALVVSECSCLTPPSAMFTRVSDGSIVADCSGLTVADCVSAGNDMCASIGSSCAYLASILQSFLDLEVDSTAPGYDAYSFGFEWTAAAASVTGVTAP
jgi:hypothetical protein